MIKIESGIKEQKLYFYSNKNLVVYFRYLILIVLKGLIVRDLVETYWLTDLPFIEVLL